MSSKILCVDDNEDNCLMLKVMLGHAGYAVTDAQTIDAALHLAQSGKFDLFILDLWLKDCEAFELCRAIRSVDGATPIIIYSGDARAAARAELDKHNVQAFLVKPNDLDVLVATVNRLIV